MAAFDGQQLSGIAGEIRSIVESETFDLAGYTEQRVKDLITAAFTSPLISPSKMIKITFVAGGGKAVRSKYDEELPKWLSSVLRDIGFTEDRSAAETFDSQGTFKRQHDTGANLIYMIIYPRVACANASANNSSQTNDAGSDTIDTTTPEYIITSCELATLKDIAAKKLSSWRQLKKALKILQDGADLFQAIEAKLIAGNPLTPKEQGIYESNSSADSEKIAWVQSEIKKMVDEGQLTSAEKDECLKAMDENLKGVSDELTKAEGKPKLISKLEEKKNNIQARKTALMGKPAITRKLKYADEIVKQRMKLIPLLVLEDKGRQMKLTLDDLNKISEKSDIEDNIKGYESASKGWFCDEQDFLLMCREIEKNALEKYKAALKKTSSSSSSTAKKSTGSKPTTNAWSTTGVKKNTMNLSNIGRSAAPKSSNSFAAFGGDDSDDD